MGIGDGNRAGGRSRDRCPTDRVYAHRPGRNPGSGYESPGPALRGSGKKWPLTMRGAPLIEARVRQYEQSADGGTSSWIPTPRRRTPGSPAADPGAATSSARPSAKCWPGRRSGSGRRSPSSDWRGSPEGAQAVRADPPGADPPGADPPGADPPGADPPGADPPGAALRGQTLRGQTLRGQTLRGQTLRGQTLRGQTLRGQTLRGQTLRGQTLRGQTLRGQTLRGQTGAPSGCQIRTRAGRRAGTPGGRESPRSRCSGYPRWSGS